VIAGIAAFREPVTAAHLIFAGLLPAGIIGLSLTAQKTAV
jgi:multidrug transporter EmrE-like cation transporter